EPITAKLQHVIRLPHGDHPHAIPPEHSMDLAGRGIRGRRMLEDLDHEDVVERSSGERQPAGDIMNQDVGGGELGRDVESLIFDIARQVVAEIAVARADVEYRAAGPYLRQPHVLAKPHPLFAGIAPGVAFAVELGELGGRRRDAIGHGSENYHGSKPMESRSFGQLPCASSTWSRRSRGLRTT